MQITFIGGGNMASALIGGLIARGQPAGSVHVIEPSDAARQKLAAQFSVSVAAAIDASALPCEVLVLAVKPQQMESAIAPLAHQLHSEVVVSIAAGTRAHSIAAWLGGYDRIVRAMPNTPALIGEGITGLYALPGVTATEKAAAQRVLEAAGQTVWVAEESQIDAITAISGSGPAYVFHFIEALEAAALHLGFEPATARKLALQTFRGASLLASSSEDSPALLREKVTSKGGTTEAALKSMAADGVFDAILRGAMAAFARGRELGAASSRSQ
ncbi:MAG: Delta 1-pyrroline-5-carboxylate reductase [Pseudomonadota bacterium]|jgi:pyrroline-5-carboxylate reductase